MGRRGCLPAGRAGRWRISAGGRVTLFATDPAGLPRHRSGLFVRDGGVGGDPRSVEAGGGAQGGGQGQSDRIASERLAAVADPASRAEARPLERRSDPGACATAGGRGPGTKARFRIPRGRPSGSFGPAAGVPVTIGPDRTMEWIWDTETYLCGYPDLIVSGGPGWRTAARMGRGPFFPTGNRRPDGRSRTYFDATRTAATKSPGRVWLGFGDRWQLDGIRGRNCPPCGGVRGATSGSGLPTKSEASDDSPFRHQGNRLFLLKSTPASLADDPAL